MDMEEPPTAPRSYEAPRASVDYDFASGDQPSHSRYQERPFFEPSFNSDELRKWDNSGHDLQTTNVQPTAMYGEPQDAFIQTQTSDAKVVATSATYGEPQDAVTSAQIKGAVSTSCHVYGEVQDTCIPSASTTTCTYGEPQDAIHGMHQNTKSSQPPIPTK